MEPLLPIVATVAGAVDNPRVLELAQKFHLRNVVWKHTLENRSYRVPLLRVKFQVLAPDAVADPKIEHQPFLNVFVNDCEDVTAYKHTVRLQLAAWHKAMAGAGQPWVVLHVAHTARSKLLFFKDSVFEKIRAEFGAKPNEGKCVQLAADGLDAGAIQEQWQNVLGVMTHEIMLTLDARLIKLRGDLATSLVRDGITGPLLIELQMSSLYESFRMYSEALRACSPPVDRLQKLLAAKALPQDPASPTAALPVLDVSLDLPATIIADYAAHVAAIQRIRAGTATLFSLLIYTASRRMRLWLLLREPVLLAEEIRLFIRFVRTRLLALRSGPAAHRWELSVSLELHYLMAGARASETDTDSDASSRTSLAAATALDAAISALTMLKPAQADPQPWDETTLSLRLDDTFDLQREHTRVIAATQSMEAWDEMHARILGTATEYYALANRQRKRIGLLGTLADVLARHKAFARAERLYLQACRWYMEDGWPMLETVARKRVLACHRELDHPGLLVETGLRLARIGRRVLPAAERLRVAGVIATTIADTAAEASVDTSLAVTLQHPPLTVPAGDTLVLQMDLYSPVALSGPITATLVLREAQAALAPGPGTVARRMATATLDTVDMNAPSEGEGAVGRAAAPATPAPTPASLSVAPSNATSTSHLARPDSPPDTPISHAPPLDDMQSLLTPAPTPTHEPHTPLGPEPAPASTNTHTPFVSPLAPGGSPATGAALVLQGTLGSLSVGSNLLRCEGPARLVGSYSLAELVLRVGTFTLRSNSLPAHTVRVHAPPRLNVTPILPDSPLLFDVAYTIPMQISAPPLPLLCGEIRVLLPDDDTELPAPAPATTAAHGHRGYKLNEAYRGDHRIESLPTRVSDETGPPRVLRSTSNSSTGPASSGHVRDIPVTNGSLDAQVSAPFVAPASIRPPARTAPSASDYLPSTTTTTARYVHGPVNAASTLPIVYYTLPTAQHSVTHPAPAPATTLGRAPARAGLPSEADILAAYTTMPMTSAPGPGSNGSMRDELLYRIKLFYQNYGRPQTMPLGGKLDEIIDSSSIIESLFSALPPRDQSMAAGLFRDFQSLRDSIFKRYELGQLRKAR
eukprot:m.55758 g.55758  ORF g.55758 m.55758 type:complete len:1094 (-) comp11986_c1_seq1:26-3307(-)